MADLLVFWGESPRYGGHNSEKVLPNRRRRNLKNPDEIWMFFQQQFVESNFGIFGALKKVGVLQYSCGVFWQYFGQIVARAILTSFFGHAFHDLFVF